MLRFSAYRKVLHYQTSGGKIPYREWMDTLKDRAAKVQILNRIDRAAMGNLGHHRSVGAGVVELKIDVGPGYRVYLGLQGEELIILLCGGHKGSQDKDIRRARDYWMDYRSRS